MVEIGETLENALVRELHEETGLDVEVGSLVEVFDRITPGERERPRFHYVLADYLCQIRGGEMRAGSDVSEVALADPVALAPYDLTDKAQAVIFRGLALTRL
jgi:8-oxo-dGTP diphosphatase